MLTLETDTGPAINGTGFVALVDSADAYTVANLSLVIPHMVAGVRFLFRNKLFSSQLIISLSPARYLPVRIRVSFNLYR